MVFLHHAEICGWLFGLWVENRVLFLSDAVHEDDELTARPLDHLLQREVMRLVRLEQRFVEPFNIGIFDTLLKKVMKQKISITEALKEVGFKKGEA